MWDVWFGRDANYSKTQSTPNDSYSSIDTKIGVKKKGSNFVSLAFINKRCIFFFTPIINFYFNHCT